jgi:hypothetical protein
MAVQPTPLGNPKGNSLGLQVSAIVMTKDITLARPQPHDMELANLSH